MISINVTGNYEKIESWVKKMQDTETIRAAQEEAKIIRSDVGGMVAQWVLLQDKLVPKDLLLFAEYLFAGDPVRAVIDLRNGEMGDIPFGFDLLMAKALADFILLPFQVWERDDIIDALRVIGQTEVESSLDDLFEIWFHNKHLHNCTGVARLIYQSIRDGGQPNMDDLEMMPLTLGVPTTTFYTSGDRDGWQERSEYLLSRGI